MQRIALILLSLISLSLLGGCNTVKGIGKDIEKGGEAIQRATN
jgi:predicted small secreted protein